MSTIETPVGSHTVQTHVQLYNDDGGLNSATPLGGAGLDQSQEVYVGQKFRLRVSVQLELHYATSYYLLLEYRVNGGSWSAVTTVSPVCIASSECFTDLSATTQRVSTSAFFPGEGVQNLESAGQFVVDAGSAATSVECEWSLQTTSALSISDFVQMRVVAASGPWSGGSYTQNVLSSYTVYGAFTIGGTMTVERATVYEASTWGVETTPGTPVAATVRLLCTELDPDIAVVQKSGRPMGMQFDTEGQSGKSHSTARLMGDLCFTDLLYKFSACLGKVSPVVPANNANWTVTVGSVISFTLTYNGHTTTSLTVSGLTATAIQTAVGNLASVGPNNVVVTLVSAGVFNVALVGALSTTVLAMTMTPTGGSGSSIAAAATGTLTNRWTWFPSFNGPDTLQTFTVEKGVAGVSGFGQQIAYFVLQQLEMKVTKDEATFQAAGFGQIIQEPFTVTTSGITDLLSIPVDEANCSVWVGPNLVGSSSLVRLTRCYNYEFTVADRWVPSFTLDDSQPSFSAAVQGSAKWDVKFTMEHDTNGQAMLANLYNNAVQYVMFEAKGMNIESGFPYRLKVTCPVKLMQGPKTSVDGVYSSDFSGTLQYVTGFGGGLKVELDTAQTSL
jgi:hypothetical protein